MRFSDASRKKQAARFYNGLNTKEEREREMRRRRRRRQSWEDEVQGKEEL